MYKPSFPHLATLTHTYVPLWRSIRPGESASWRPLSCERLEAGHLVLLPRAPTPVSEIPLVMDYETRNATPAIEPWSFVMTVRLASRDLAAFRLEHNALVTRLKLLRHGQKTFSDVEFCAFSFWFELRDYLDDQGIGAETVAIIKHFMVDGLRLPEKLHEVSAA